MLVFSFSHKYLCTWCIHLQFANLLQLITNNKICFCLLVWYITVFSGSSHWKLPEIYIKNHPCKHQKIVSKSILTIQIYIACVFFQRELLKTVMYLNDYCHVQPFLAVFNSYVFNFLDFCKKVDIPLWQKTLFQGTWMLVITSSWGRDETRPTTGSTY